MPPRNDFDGAIAVMLEHRDKGLSVPLLWRLMGGTFLWNGAPGRVYSVCLRWSRTPTANCAIRSGRSVVSIASEKSPHRLGRATMMIRRGRGRIRRKPGVSTLGLVHEGERELIARIDLGVGLYLRVHGPLSPTQDRDHSPDGFNDTEWPRLAGSRRLTPARCAGRTPARTTRCGPPAHRK